MTRLGELVGVRAGVLTNFDVWDGQGAAAVMGIDPTVLDTYFAHWSTRNPFNRIDDPQHYLDTWRPAILRDQNWLPRDSLTRTDYYNEFQKPIEAEFSVMIRLGLDGSKVAVMNLGRSERAGAFEDREIEVLAAYHSHLIRAYSLGRKLDLAAVAGGGGMADALHASALGVVLLEASGRIRHVNRAAEAMLEGLGVLRIEKGRLKAVTASEDKLLQGLIAGVGPNGWQEASHGAGLSLRSPLRRSPIAVTVAAVGAREGDLLRPGPTIMVCLSDPEAGWEANDRTLRGMFGLTASEHRLAMALFEGLSLRQYADRREVSINTLRVQLASIFHKTGVSKQAQLIRLIADAGRLHAAPGEARIRHRGWVGHG